MKRLLCVAVLAAALSSSAGAAPAFTFSVMIAVRPGDGNGIQVAPGPVWTLGPAGEIYRDSVRSSGAARLLFQFGNDVYSQGRTVPIWWRWDGSKWVAATITLDTLAAAALAAPPVVAGDKAKPVTLKAAPSKAGTPR